MNERGWCSRAEEVSVKIGAVLPGLRKALQSVLRYVFNLKPAPQAAVMIISCGFLQEDDSLNLSLLQSSLARTRGDNCLRTLSSLGSP